MSRPQSASSRLSVFDESESEKFRKLSFETFNTVQLPHHTAVLSKGLSYKPLQKVMVCGQNLDKVILPKLLYVKPIWTTTPQQK